MLLGLGFGALLHAIVFGGLALWLHLAMWLVALAGVAVLFSAVRGPGPLPYMRVFAGWLLGGAAAANIVQSAVARNWPLLAAAALALVVGALLVRRPTVADWVDRRSGYDRRSPAAERLSRGA